MRPNHLTETKTSQIAIFHYLAGLSRNFYLGKGDVLKSEYIFIRE